MTGDDRTLDTRMLDEVAATFLGGKPKRARAKPHRCHDCGKVTKHVRCDACAKARYAS